MVFFLLKPVVLDWESQMCVFLNGRMAVEFPKRNRPCRGYPIQSPEIQQHWISVLFCACFYIHVCTQRWTLFHCKTQVSVYLWFCPPLQFPPFFCSCTPCNFILSFSLPRAVTKRVNTSLSLPPKLGHRRERRNGGAAGL